MRCNRSTRPRRTGLSLPELLVVVGIVVVLIAILLPVLGGVRKMARSTACLANLQQWGQSFQIYVSNNKGRTFPEIDGARRWVELFAPYNGDVRAALLCPEANEPLPGAIPPGAVKNGSALNSWQGRTLVGSYGFNRWIGDYGRRLRPPYDTYPVRVVSRGADRIPLLGDCMIPYTNVMDTDRVPPNLRRREGSWGDLAEYCIDRHAMAVNLVFLDGHGERVPLAGLWKLKWSEGFTPRDVTVPRRGPA